MQPRVLFWCEQFLREGCRSARYTLTQARLAVLGVSLCAVWSAQAEQPQLIGRVLDENDAPVGLAQITAELANPPAVPAIRSWQTQAEPTGVFKLNLPAPGKYLVTVRHEGYFELKNYPIEVTGPHEVTLVINQLREVFQTLDVKETPSPVDIAQTENHEQLTATEINDVPYPSNHNLRNAMTIMPGVILDPAGGLHFNGSSENQILYILNGFNITDPITGQFHTRLGLEGVRSVDYATGRYSPEYGKGSAGVLAIRTDTGSDAFHYTATDFFPALDFHQGVRFGNWYPRVGVSGPIVRGRAWFADNFQSEYDQGIVTGLPAGQNTRTSWAGSNLLHGQVNLSPTNIIFADFLVNILNQTHEGLTPLDPVSTTLNTRGREYFASVKDQYYFSRGALVEFGYAHSEFSDVSSPQGDQLYILSPLGRSGNYFVNSTQTARRDQVLVDGYLPTFHFAGNHQIKAGTDVDRLNYDGSFHRTGYEQLGLTNNKLSETLFEGPGTFHFPDTQFSAYVLDTWRLNKRLQLDLGLRTDKDQLVQDVAVSPRISVSWSPFASGRTRIAGGYAMTYDTVSLGTFGRPFDQTAFTTNFDPAGLPVGPPAATVFERNSPHLELPRAVNWTASIDHQIREHLFAQARYVRRRLTNGYTYVNALDAAAPPSELPLPDTAFDGLYQLTNDRRDNYDAVEVSVRQTFSGQYEWMASFRHSRTVSNAMLDFNAIDPVQVLDILRPVPWDAPNRAIAWCYLPLPFKNWAVSALVDARTGLPFSVVDERGLIIGGVDAHRYPINFALNLAIERILTLRGYRFALRGGVNNLTNQRNPTAVNNVFGSSQFLHFYGDEGRHFVVRIRFFGHAK